MREEQIEREEEIECLQSQLREQEGSHQALITHLEHELQLKQ